MDNEAFQAWLATRPESVRRLAAEFPAGTCYIWPGHVPDVFYVISYGEDDTLGVSPHDPFDDYDVAVATRVRLCASHLRELSPC